MNNLQINLATSGFHKLAILDSVTILSNYRGHGYGKQMMQHDLKISANSGCYKVTLSSGIQRERAHNFYQSLEFQQYGWSFTAVETKIRTIENLTRSR